MQLGTLDVSPPVRMTPCPQRLQLQTLWMGGILTGEIAFQRDKRFAKVVSSMHLGALNVSPPVRMTPWPHRIQLQSSGTGGIWAGKLVSGRYK